MAKAIPDRKYVYKALLKYNYLPIGKKNPDDIPFDAFSTEGFKPKIADVLVNNYSRKRTSKNGEKVFGYDQIEYRATRFNLVTRLMHIPHPAPYARLCKRISEHWDELEQICQNENSRETLGKYNKSRKILGEKRKLKQISQMSYNKLSDTHFRLELSTGKFFRVKADISACYPSIYTHSIPWAEKGRFKAKANSRKNRWYNQLDEAQRDVKRNETQGIPIGPATSHIVSEFILSKVDKVLQDNDFQFVRYIDDYECYCKTRKKAEKFIVLLEKELREYLLNLNSKKVLIEELPLPFEDQWIAALKLNLPKEKKRKKKKKTLNSKDILNFTDIAVDLQKEHPDGSVLKYATRMLASKKFGKKSIDYLLKHLIALSVHRPTVLPILCEVAKKYQKGSDLDITPVLKQSIRFRRSDAICWCLYYLAITGQKLCHKLADKIIETGDCMSMGMLLAIKQHKNKVVKFLDDKVDPNSYYQCDQYWILLHELTNETPSFKRYRGDSGLKFLFDNNVHFIKSIDPFSNS